MYQPWAALNEISKALVLKAKAFVFKAKVIKFGLKAKA